MQAAFTENRPEAVREGKAFDEATLEELRARGFRLQPIDLPDLPISETQLLTGLFGELSATWDSLIRNRSDRMMTRHARTEFGSVCRTGRFVPAVEYIQANRVRTLLMEEMDRLMKQVELYVAPVSEPAGPIADANLSLTNLTGHPAVVLPNGLTRRGTPLGISFIGRLYGEAELLAVAKAYQDATAFHRQHPKLS